MKRYLLTRLVDRLERLLGVELPYLRVVADHAPGALVPIGLTMPASAYGRRVPAPVLHMVRLGATQAQDCGECLQIAVNVALADGVPAEDIQVALEGRGVSLPEEYRDAFDFGFRVADGSGAERLRDVLRERYAERGVIEASMAAAGAQFFPALKRGMGYAQACDLEHLSLGPAASRAP
jgi:alkylhydroperoxidase family enzyme